jgi:hypothetical protein
VYAVQGYDTTLIELHCKDKKWFADKGWCYKVRVEGDGSYNKHRKIRSSTVAGNNQEADISGDVVGKVKSGKSGKSKVVAKNVQKDLDDKENKKEVAKNKKDAARATVLIGMVEAILEMHVKNKLMAALPDIAKAPATETLHQLQAVKKTAKTSMLTGADMNLAVPVAQLCEKAKLHSNLLDNLFAALRKAGH